MFQTELHPDRNQRDEGVTEFDQEGDIVVNRDFRQNPIVNHSVGSDQCTGTSRHRYRKHMDLRILNIVLFFLLSYSSNRFNVPIFDTM